VMAGLVLLRWFQLLFMFRGFKLLGPKLLPILFTLKSMGPFLIVLLFYVVGFLHAYWTLSSRSFGEVILICYRLGIMGDFSLTSDEDTDILEDKAMDGWIMVWFFGCSSLLTIFMMNVVIGVLGDSYDVEQERSEVSFYQSRAHICFEYFSRMYKTKSSLPLYKYIEQALYKAESSQSQCVWSLIKISPICLLYVLQRVFVCVHQDRAAPFLWVCNVAEEAEDSRHSMISMTAARVNDSLAQMEDRLKSKLEHAQQDQKNREDTMVRAMEQMSKKVEWIANHLKHMESPVVTSQSHPMAASAGLADERIAGTGSFKCPFSGVRIPNEVTNPPSQRSGQVCPQDVGKASADTALRGLQHPQKPAEPLQTNTPHRPDGSMPPTEALFYGHINDSIEQPTSTS